ncbi:helix-turn-helix transcriptional regulator [Ilumatobacter coccineus]|uniref:Putative LuxR family transcriptional regulator n=1 Tax=Ilumatobacter coccineus (strain NBRC 103263 / KCTC 29153 / YM16-304) TaxID=1313172 RepID=A0A6C7EBM8_ILUCY|nr:LuxR family transcriptional regulator [Ilumatobacter coccineus]BAN03881.1 putative LuxR family transcriptional regulator [Ilumatobacter coccineus YM16-304]
MGEVTERRADVVARLVDRLGSAERPTSVVLRGPAGIGKSHLAAAVAARLAERGLPVRRAAGGEAQRQLGFGALLHLLPADAAPVSVEFELVQRLRSALISQAHTAVLVVDDIALLDDRSAGLIEGVLLHGDVVVVATERTPLSGAPTEHALSAVLRSTAEFVDVPAMSSAELAELLLDWAGPGEIGSVRRLCEMARGNPLVLRELLTSARSTGGMSERGGLWYLDGFRASGHSLERLVSEHLDRLDEHAWELMRCLAVAGTLPRHLAARIDVESLERLERDGLLRGDPTTIGHPLYAEVIVDSLSAEQVRRVCSKLVASIGPHDDVDAARLGSWLLRADHGIDDTVARRGVALALARWENDLARRLIEAIAEPTVDDRVQLIWAHANAGEIDQAAEAAEAAVDSSSTDHERVHAELARAELWALQMNRSREAYAALADLRARLSDATLVAQVDGATALYSQMTGNSALASVAGASASAAAEVDDDESRLAVLMADAFGKVFSGAFDAARSSIEAGLALAEQRAERHQWVRLKIADALRAFLSGELALCRSVVDEALDLADVSGVRPAHVVWLGLASQVAQVDGDYDLAERRAREAVRAGDHVDDFGSAGFARGDLDALLIELGRAVRLDSASSKIGRARGQIRLAPSAEADQLAAELAATTAEAGYVLWGPWIAREAVRRGPSPRCAELLATWADEHDGPVVRALSEHASGLVEADAERVGNAARSLEQAGYRMPSLEAFVASFELALEQGDDSPMLRRRILATRALVDGVVPCLPPMLAERYDAVCEAAGMPTDRQIEIARLAAAGKASKEIAAELVVSARTVDNHLAAVYKKLGVNSRDGLADLLA